MDNEEYNKFLSYFDENYFEGKSGNWSSEWLKKYEYFQPFWFERAIWVWKQFRPKNILEIGCGTGYLIRQINEKLCPAIGVDISEYAINKGKKICPNLIKGDVRNLPINDMSCDMVIGFDILEHIPEEFIDQVISEINRVCYRYCFFNIPLKNSFDKFNDLEHDPSHVLIRDKKFWMDKFEKYFTVLNQETRFWLIKKGFPIPLIKLSKYWTEHGTPDYRGGVID